MFKFVEELSNELDNSGVEPLFEIEVTNKEGETDFITCNVFFKGNSILAKRDAVSTKELRSKYIASSRIVCDSAFNLDIHLSAIYEKVLEDIQDGDLYEIS